MGIRGPKPVLLSELQFWEKEWWQSFRFLRNGDYMPRVPRWSFEAPLILDPRAPGKIVKWKTRGLAVEGRQDIWDALLAAKSMDQVKKGCDRWENWIDGLTGKKLFAEARLAGILSRPRETWPEKLKHAVKVDLGGPAGFPAPMYVRRYAYLFLAAKRDRRFPSKRYTSDNARLDHMARAMAGVLCDVSPATGVDKLRKVKHIETDAKHVSQCWRCTRMRWEKHAREELQDFAEGRYEDIERQTVRREQAFHTALAMHPAWTVIAVSETRQNSGHWAASYRDREGRERVEKFFLKKENG